MNQSVGSFGKLTSITRVAAGGLVWALGACYLFVVATIYASFAVVDAPYVAIEETVYYLQGPWFLWIWKSAALIFVAVGALLTISRRGFSVLNGAVFGGLAALVLVLPVAGWACDLEAYQIYGELNIAVDRFYPPALWDFAPWNGWLCTADQIDPLRYAGEPISELDRALSVRVRWAGFVSGLLSIASGCAAGALMALLCRRVLGLDLKNAEA